MKEIDKTNNNMPNGINFDVLMITIVNLLVNKNYPYYIFISGLMISRSMSIPQKDSYSSIVDTLIKIE